MKFYSATPRLTITMVLGSFLLIAFSRSVDAANPEYENTQAERTPGFFQRASDNIGGFFHRVFNQDDAPPPPPQRQHAPRSSGGNPTRSGGPRQNLDEPPEGVAPIPPKKNSSTSPSKSGTGSAKPSSGKHASGDTEEPKVAKTKPSSTSQEKKEVVVKNNPPTQKLPTLNKPTPSNTTDTGSSTETKPNGKTESTPPSKISQEQNVLTGSKTSKAGRVKSPYPPYNELDVSGLGTGSLALDPTTQKVFKVP